jgi:hypothetical protein
MPEVPPRSPLHISPEEAIQFRLDELVAQNRRGPFRAFVAGLFAAAIPVAVLGVWLDMRLDRIDDDLDYLRSGVQEIDSEVDRLLYREGPTN